MPVDSKTIVIAWLNQTWDFIPKQLFGRLADQASLLSMRDFDHEIIQLLASPGSRCSCGENWSVPCWESDQGLVVAEDRQCGCGQRLGESAVMALPVAGFPCGGSLLYPRSEQDRAWVEANLGEVAALGFYVFSSVDVGVMVGLDSVDPNGDEYLAVHLHELLE